MDFSFLYDMFMDENQSLDDIKREYRKTSMKYQDNPEILHQLYEVYEDIVKESSLT